MGAGSTSDLSSSEHPVPVPALGKRAVFLDRDGTLIRHREYLTDLSDLELLDGTCEAVGLLNRRHIPAVVITNQSAVARGLLNEEELQVIHAEIQSRLQDRGVFLDAFYYCPHHPLAGEAPYRQHCNCRKPEPGLILRASDELEISPRMSFMVGDSDVDIEAGRLAGCRTILVADPGEHATTRAAKRGSTRPDRVVRDVLEAVRWILEEIG